MSKKKITNLYKAPFSKPILFLFALFFPYILSYFTYSKLFNDRKEVKKKIFLTKKNDKDLYIKSFDDEYIEYEEFNTVIPNKLAKNLASIMFFQYNAFVQRRLIFNEIESIEKSLLVSTFLWPFSYVQTLTYMKEEGIYIYRDRNKDIKNFYKN